MGADAIFSYVLLHSVFEVSAQVPISIRVVAGSGQNLRFYLSCASEQVAD